MFHTSRSRTVIEEVFGQLTALIVVATLVPTATAVYHEVALVASLLTIVPHKRKAGLHITRVTRTTSGAAIFVPHTLIGGTLVLSRVGKTSVCTHARVLGKGVGKATIAPTVVGAIAEVDIASPRAQVLLL